MTEYDEGGVLPPGPDRVCNDSGGLERVEAEPSAEWDATEERTAAERQAHLEAAILHDAGAEFVEELVQPLGGFEPDADDEEAP